MLELRIFSYYIDALLISSIVLPIRPRLDQWVWTPTTNGKFSTRFAYLLSNRHRCIENPEVPKQSWLRL